MNRQPTLLDPRTPMLPTPPERPARLIPWGFVWLGIAILTVAAAVAWFSVNPNGDVRALLNLSSPAGNVPENASKGSESATTATGLDRAVAIAYVDVEKGVTPLYPVRPGRVVAVLVNEGDEVKKDQELVKIDDDLAQRQLSEAKLALEGAKLGKEKAEQLVIHHQEMIKGQEEQISLRESDVSLAEAVVEKAKHMFDERLGGTRKDIRIAELNVQKARKGVDAEKVKLAGLRRADPTVAVRAAEVDIKAKQEQVEKAQAELKNYVLRAPAKGKILQSWVNVGETLGTNPHRPAMEFCPNTERIIRAEVEQEYSSLVRTGMKATIHDFDGSKASWDGEVTRVSDWIKKRRSQVFEPLQFNDVRTLEVIIRLKSEPEYPLRIGQRVRVILQR